MTKNKDNLICFDLDGVLISSMVIANKIFFDVIERELDLPMHDYRDQKNLMALSGGQKIQLLWSEEIKKRGITDERMEEVRQIYRNKRLEMDIPILPHAEDAVKLMVANFEKIACVSSNSKIIIDDTLMKLGLRDCFKKITGTDDVEVSKPDPEIYSITAEHFDIKPSKCLVFEDSTHGIHSAKGAGMNVVAVATGLESVEELEKAGPDRIIRDFSELSMDMIKELI